MDKKNLKEKIKEKVPKRLRGRPLIRKHRKVICTISIDFEILEEIKKLCFQWGCSFSGLTEELYKEILSGRGSIKVRIVCSCGEVLYSRQALALHMERNPGPDHKVKETNVKL